MRKQVRIFRVGHPAEVSADGLSENLMHQIREAAEQLGCKPDDLYAQFNVAAFQFDPHGVLWVIVEFFL